MTLRGLHVQRYICIFLVYFLCCTSLYWVLITQEKQNEIVGSSYSSALYISRILRLQAPHNKVFVLGERGIEAELESQGIPHTGGTDPAYTTPMTDADYAGIADGSALDPDVAVVLAGLDRAVSYKKYSLAMAYLRRGATFLCTNPDSTLPNARSTFPGAGATFAPLVAATGITPLSLGKPGTAMLDAVESDFRFDRAKACMVGDRLDTDIQFGIDGGLGGTLCVLSGTSTKDEVLAEKASIVPSAYADSLADLLLD